MSICLPQQCLALVNGLPPPGDPLFRESPGWWVRLRSVGHKHRTCSHVFVPENVENFEELLYVYMSTPAMPGSCECIFFWGQQMNKTVDFLFPGNDYTKVPQKKSQRVIRYDLPPLCCGIVHCPPPFHLWNSLPGEAVPV